MTNTDSLSSVFISHVKILFDILDETNSGFVRLSDIESHWEGNDCMIPGDVVFQSLRNVASPSGRLSFDTFTVGLQRALIAWKSSRTDQNEIIRSNENRGLSPRSTTSHESVSVTHDNSSSDSTDRLRHVHNSSAVWHGVLRYDDAANIIGSLTPRASTDGLKQWRHQETLAGNNGKFADVQQRKYNEFSKSGMRSQGSVLRRHRVSSEVNANAVSIIGVDYINADMQFNE